MKYLLGIFSLSVLTLAGCANVEQGDPPVQSAAAEPGDNVAAAPAGDTYRVLFETTTGNFTIEVHPEWSPEGAKHFKELVEDGFYTDCAFFRAVPNFMVQFGIAGDPAMNTKWDKTIKDDPVVKSNSRGYVTYAKTNDPNSRSTQVFISFKDNSFLDRQGFSPFAIVLDDGMKIVDSINQEYGEPPGDAQFRLKAEGNAYLKAKMPNLDYIKSATIVGAE